MNRLACVAVLVVLGMTVHGEAPVIRPAVQLDSMKPAMGRTAAQQIA